jgi:oligogalacturonide lyase
MGSPETACFETCRHWANLLDAHKDPMPMGGWICLFIPGNGLFQHLGIRLSFAYQTPGFTPDPMTRVRIFTALRRTLIVSAALSGPAGFPARGADQEAAPSEPPVSWTDPDTGHRVFRLTREPNSASFYFNDNGYTPDGKEMVYTTREGVSVLNLATLQARQVVQGPVRTVVVGRKTPTIYYLKATKDPLYFTLWGTNLDTGEARKLADLPRRGGISTVNADETLACGTYLEGDPPALGGYARGPRIQGQTQSQNGIQPRDKGQMMTQRLAARLPIDMYTVDLRTGATKVLLHSTDWLNHMQFSPTDPALLLYCHEGHWQLVDRIWSIRTDGTQNRLIHQRTMEGEIAGHEWWGADGKNIWYQLHYPSAMKTSFLASYDVQTGERTWYHYDLDATSIHHNASPDGLLFCGDGDPSNPWIVLVRPTQIADNHTLGTNLIKGGYTRAEKLVNMSKHNYALEPNPSFSPDQRLVIFSSNMFGPSYVFGVEVAKDAPARP